MSLPMNSYHLHHRPPIAPSDRESSHLFTKPKAVSFPPDSANRRQRAYWHVDISYVQVTLQFVSLPSPDIKILQPIISYYWWPRKIHVHEHVNDGANTVIFDLSIKRGKSWGMQDNYLAKRDLVRLQLEIFRALHGRGWVFRCTAGYTVEQPGLVLKTSLAPPSSYRYLFPFACEKESPRPCDWLMLTMHYSGELWVVSSAPRNLVHAIMYCLRRTSVVFRDQNRFYRLLLQGPCDTAILRVLETLEDFGFGVFAYTGSWPPTIVVNRPRDGEADT